MTDHMKPYPEYKDSALKWLGKIPAHWTEKRAKYFLREVDERSTTGEEQLMSVSHKTGVTPRKSNVTMFKAESNIGHKICRVDDLAINTLWAWMSALGVSRYTGLVSPAYGVYRQVNSDNFDSKYLDYLLRTPAYATEYRCKSTGITSSRLRLYPIDFLRIPLIQPPRKEQEKIVRFLKHQDTLIRQFIRNRRRLIEVLTEQKQAIIARAVTRGLDPSVKLIPSGVDWLGDVPEHWEVVRLKWVTRLQRGYDLPEHDRIPGKYPVVSSGGVIDHHDEFRASAPGIVMGRYGSTEAIFFMNEDFWPHNTSLFVTDFQGNDPRWCFHILKSISKADHAGKSAVPGIDRKDLYDVKVVRPPYEDQIRINSVIAEESVAFDASISIAESEIDRITEFRTRLISDTITGKLDVRNLALPNSNEMTQEESDHFTDELDFDEELAHADD